MITFQDLGLQKFAKEKQYQQYLRMLNEFVDIKSKEKNVSHIFVGGSFATGEMSQYSDLDFYIFKETTKKLTQQATKIDNVEIDYFLLNENIVKKEIVNEKNSNSRLFSQGITKLKRIYGDSMHDYLVDYAKKIVNSSILKQSKENIKNTVTFLKNQRFKLGILYETGDIIGFHLRLNHVISCCFESYFKHKRILRPAWKKITSSIKDKKFLILLQKTLFEKDEIEKYKQLQRLIDYTVNMLEKE